MFRMHNFSNRGHIRGVYPALIGKPQGADTIFRILSQELFLYLLFLLFLRGYYILLLMTAERCKLVLSYCSCGSTIESVYSGCPECLKFNKAGLLLTSVSQLFFNFWSLIVILKLISVAVKQVRVARIRSFRFLSEVLRYLSKKDFIVDFNSLFKFLQLKIEISLLLLAQSHFYRMLHVFIMNSFADPPVQLPCVIFQFLQSNAARLSLLFI
jgi:hypothetical protein